MMPVATIGAKRSPIGFGWSDVTDFTDSVGNFGSNMISRTIDADIPVISDLAGAGRDTYDFTGDMGDIIKRNTSWFTSHDYDAKTPTAPTETATASKPNWFLIGGIGIAAFLLLKK
jgi:hypothetical protein